ncbi:MAG: adenylate kinase [Christensenellales bacterium]|jgi:adenylate kinase
MSIRLILLGPPGAGKGTQAARICEKANCTHMSTGEILRAEIKSGSALGNTAHEYISRGNLVPDSIVIDLVAAKISKDDCAKGYLLDGFPRTLIQAEAIENRIPVDVVINIDVPTPRLLDRLTGRRVCSKCGANYHISAYNRKDCEKCGGELYHRDDDKLETVLNRLGVYAKQTQPLIEYYKKKGILYTVDGTKGINDVFSDIMNILESEVK